MISKLYDNQEGSTMVEYCIVVSLIAAVCIGVVTSLGIAVNTKLFSPIAATNW